MDSSILQRDTKIAKERINNAFEDIRIVSDIAQM